MATVNIYQMSTMPSIGSLLGATRSNEVIEELRARSGGGVMFGQAGDPYAASYNFLRQVYYNDLYATNQIVAQASVTVEEPVSAYVAVTDVDQMCTLPPTMYEPILMYEPVRELVKEKRIWGFGVDPANLPSEDVFGRLIDNGTANTADADAPMTWVFRSTDPDVTQEDLNRVKETRDWLYAYLKRTMSPEGSWTDPTDPDNTIARKKKEEEE